MEGREPLHAYTSGLIARPPRAPDRASLASAVRVALPIWVAGAAALFYGAVSIFRHDRFGSSGYDLGIFDQTIWGYSRFEFVRNTIKGTPNLLGDHFHPALMLLAPAARWKGGLDCCVDVLTP